MIRKRLGDAPVARPRLYLSHDAHYDWLIAVEFGEVDGRQLPER